MRRTGFAFLVFVAARIAGAATFGTAVPVTGAATDLVLDEVRGRLYIVNSTQNRIEVYSTAGRSLLDPIPTSRQPLAAALSRGSNYLYVTSYAGSSLDVIDLESMAVTKRVGLPAAPEGVAVGADDCVLITTVGAGTSNAESRILRYDPNATGTDNLLAITSTLAAPGTPATPSAGQAYNSSRSHLLATPDGRLIVGLNNPTNSTRTVFVYEVASSSILRSRSVSNISSVLSVAPDGSRFMAGLSLFDTETLAITAQQNAANSLYPFSGNVNFNTQSNQGGSVFAPDGSVLYTAFNIAPMQANAPANSSQLMLNDPDNLLIQLGIQMPENLTGKMVVSSNGAVIYALSQSGFLVLPVANIYDSPIAAVESPAVVLANDQCGVTEDQRKVQVRVRNQGRGRMTVAAQVNQSGVTFTFPLGGQAGGATPGGGGTGGGAGGGAPGQLTPIAFPGGGGPVTVPPGAGPTTTIPAAGRDGTATTTQQRAIVQNAPQVTARPSGTDTILEFTFNSRAASSLGTGTPTDFLVQSPEAINIPSRVRVYQNNRNAEAAGSVVPVPISVSTSEGLADLVLDSARQRLYIANSGLNRLEVLDTNTNQFLDPIKVGQLPRSLALSPDGNTLYVANTGGESISIVDLEQGRVTGRVRFPPVAYNASYAVITPSVIAASVAGLQIVMSSGALWKAVNNQAMPRPTSTVIGTSTLQSPRSMIATPDGEYILLLAGNGVAYLYDAMSDEYVLSQQAVATPIQGYYGAMAAGPHGQFFVVNNRVLNRSLTPVGTTTTTATANRISALAAVNANTVARFVQPTRANTSAAVTEAPSVELVDATTGNARGAATPVLEGPLSTQTGNTRVNVSARTMAVDPSGSTIYLLTASGLTMVPLGSVAPRNRPQVNANGVVNIANYQTAIAPGSVVSIFGQNLASEETAAGLPFPTALGGTCVTIDNAAVPVLMTSPTQINVQLPPELTAARHSLVVRSFERLTAGAAQSITVSKYAPAIYMDGPAGEAAIFHTGGRRVTRSAPANRDESLSIYATGMGVTSGGKVTAGDAAPADPLAVTQPVQVFFGDARYKEAAMIVEWSGLVPGMVGLYQINVRVPGARLRGDALPVTLKIGGVSSPTTGEMVPVVAVD